MTRLYTPRVHGGIKLGFDYTYTKNEAARTAVVTCSLTPYPFKDTDGDRWNATYHFLQDFRGKTNYIKLNWGNGKTEESWDKVRNSNYSGGNPSYHAVCDNGSWYDNNYNKSTKWVKNDQGYSWYVYFLGTKFYTKTFTVNYKKDGTASFSVYVDFAWYCSGSQSPSQRQIINETVKLDSITPIYDITYDAKGGSGAPSAGTKYKDKAYSVPATKPTKTGYDFVNWKIKRTNEGTYTGYFVNAGGTISANSNNYYTLEAQWKKKEIPITYDANGGTGGPKNDIKYYDEVYNVPETEPKKTGYTFNYWDIVETGYTVKAGKTITAGSNRLTGYTLKANWTANKYIITLKDHPKLGTGKYYLFEQTFDEKISSSNLAKFTSYTKTGYEQLTNTFEKNKGRFLWVENLTTEAKKVYTSSSISDSEKKEIVSRGFNYNSPYTIAKNITLYPVLKYSTTCYVKVSGKWKLAIPYVKVSGKWKQALMHGKHNGKWKL